MSEIIGAKPRRRGKGRIQLVFIILIALAAGSAYIYFNYVWPQKVLDEQFKKVVEVEKLMNEDCGEDDTSCKERAVAAVHRLDNNIFVKASKSIPSDPDIKRHFEKAHRDGTICFLADGKEDETVSEEKLVIWLGDYGSQKFLDDKPLIARAKNLYERRYHLPTPLLAEYKLLKSLRWRHLPFGQTWRNYTLAARFIEWSSLIRPHLTEPKPSAEERRVMRAMKKDPAFFTDKNIDQLTQLAKRELTLERLSKIRDGLKRFRSDVREYPIGNEGTTLELPWLASTKTMHPWLKRRWHGPYVKEEELNDLWGCPVVGTRTPKTGAMSLVAYGSDCKEGGEANGEDIALSVTTYVAKPKEPTEQAVKKKQRKIKKKRNLFVLP